MHIIDEQLFVQLVEYHSFTAAADALNMSRSAISRRLSELEQSMGARLIQRTTRSFSLTEPGEAYYRYCLEVLSLRKEVGAKIREQSTETSGILHVSMPVPVGAELIAPLLSDFRGVYPKVNVRMTLSDQIEDFVAKGYDVGIRMGSLSDSSLVSRKLADLDLVVCASPDYWQSYGMPQTPHDLRRHDCLVYTPLRHGHQLWRFNEGDRAFTVPVNGSMESNEGTSLIHAAANGAGVVLAPRCQVGHYLSNGRLQPALEDYQSRGEGIYVIYPHRTQVPKRVRALIDFLVQEVPKKCGLKRAE